MAAFLGGCGGTASLTGGSIPTGATTSRAGDLTGTVVSSTSLDAPLDGVEVRAVLPDGSQRTQVTDRQGGFAFNQVGEGDIRLEIVPPPRHGAHARNLVVRVTPDEETVVAVVLAAQTGPATPQLHGTLAVRPSAITVQVGQQVDFTVVLRQEGLPELPPLWVVEGNIGAISPRGRFLAKRPGRGRVIALLGDQRAVAEVTVRAEAP